MGMRAGHKGGKRRVYTLLAVIIVLGLLLSSWMYAGPDLLFDDIGYITMANQFMSGNYNFLTANFGFGFLDIASIAASFWAFGYGNVQAVIPSVVEYVVMVVLVFLVASRVHKDETALLAAFFTATSPLLVANATRALPDIATGMVTAASMLVFVVGLRSSRKFLFGIAFGIVTTLVVYVKMTGIIIMCLSLLFVLAYLLLRRSHVRAEIGAYTINARYAIGAFLGVAIMSAVFLSVFYVYTGNALFAFEHYNNPAGAGPLQKLWSFLNQDTFSVLGQQTFNVESYPIGPLLLLAALGSAFAVKERNPPLCQFSLLLWGVALYFILGSGSIGAYTPVPYSTRYFAIVLPAMAILAAYATVQIAKFVAKRSRSTPHRRHANSYAVFLIIAIVLVLESPLYAALWQYNTGIGQLDTTIKQASSHAMLYLHTNGTMLGGSPIIYVEAIDGLSGPLIYAIQYELGYPHGISYFRVNNYDYPYNDTYICNSSAFSKPLISMYYFQGSESVNSSAQWSSISQWLKAGQCGITYIGAFYANYTDTKIYLYRVNASS